MCAASMVMGPGSSALLVCARAGAAARSASASVAKRYPMERAAMLLMLEFSMIHADSRRAALESWLAAQLRGARFSLTPASVDASFRRYFRAALPDGRSYVVMDAPPGKEDCRPFVHVAGLLRAAGVHAPEVHAGDLAQGFLLLGDLGTQTYLQELNADNAARLLGDATDALLRWQLATRPGELPPYDEALLRREMDLFPEWYVSRHLGVELSNAQKSGLEGIFRLLVKSALAQPAVYVHRDYMPRNLMVSDPNPGVLDFQDAVLGPITYDMASLLRDAFVSWDEELVLDWGVRYWEKAKRAGLPVETDFAEFWRAFEWMGLQRHLKVLGIFARINYRDGKPKYLADTPRFIGYVRAVSARYAALAPLACLLVNSDVYCEVEFEKLLRHSLAGRLGHLVLVPNPLYHPAGDFTLDHGLIGNGAGPRYTYAGVAVMSPALFAQVEPGERAPLAPLLRAAAERRLLSGEPYAGLWQDVGSAERLAELRARLASRNETY